MQAEIVLRKIAAATTDLIELLAPPRGDGHTRADCAAIGPPANQLYNDPMFSLAELWRSSEGGSF